MRGLSALAIIAAATAFTFHLRGSLVMAVDKNKFRKCSDTGFCRRHRERKAPARPFRIEPASVRVEGSSVVASIIPSDGGTEPLALSLSLLVTGAARLRVTERPSAARAPRWEAPDILVQGALLPAPSTVIVPASDASLPPAARAQKPGSALHLRYGAGAKLLASLTFEPPRLDLYVGDATEPAVTVNAAQLLHFEQRRKRVVPPAAQITEQEEDAAASEGENDQEPGSESGAGGTSEDPYGGKEVVDYGEDGLAIFSDGTKETVESHRRRLAADAAAAAAADSSGLGMWEEGFDGHQDSKPQGPMSVGLDVSFVGSRHLYGIPEHASAMSLKRTRAGPPGSSGGGGGSGSGNDDDAEEGARLQVAGAEGGYSEPYRLYTLDVFEYELDVPMALYGVIPLLVSHKAGQTCAAFWLNPSETFVDVYDTPASGAASKDGAVSAHWLSESGVVDITLLPGPTPAEVFSQYAALTGTPELPPIFSLGFHQCRWNYKDEKDVIAVDAGFEQHDIPYDVIWLDIEHTDGKRYFTWDFQHFPDPKRMLAAVAAHGRKTVTIVDPHIKRDDKYAIHSEATAKRYYIRDKEGKDFDGWCWPGSSSYLDFTSPVVREWWATRFSLDNYKGSTLDLFTWNDMNEPSVFNGPEVSMRKDCVSIAGVEHREWHNLYGMYMQRATAEGLIQRSNDNNLRPFVLSRAFFAGSQRWGAVWTGDNRAKWEHMAIAAPMLLSMSVAGLPFVGADVGGFFGDPSEELFLRWLQAGAYTPFFRSHAHHDSKRREPWVFGEPWTTYARSAIAERYTLLSHWYTLFWHASRSGMPPMRPLWVHYGDDPATFTIDDEWLVGKDLLVKPVAAAGEVKADVLFPGGSLELWYDVRSYYRKVYKGAANGGRAAVAAPVEQLPVFQRGGSVIPRQMRLRRSSQTMRRDPFTLVVALDSNAAALGDLYTDDGETFAFQSDEWIHRLFQFSGDVLVGKAGEQSKPSKFAPANTVERIVVAGLRWKPREVVLRHAGSQRSLDFAFESEGADDGATLLTVRNPGVPVVDDFEVAFVR